MDGPEEYAVMAIRGKDLIKYMVQDSGNEPRAGCTINRKLDIVVAGKAYCLWCVGHRIAPEKHESLNESTIRCAP